MWGEDRIALGLKVKAGVEHAHQSVPSFPCDALGERSLSVNSILSFYAAASVKAVSVKRTDLVRMEVGGLIRLVPSDRWLPW